MIEAVIFDIDGTLVDTVDFHAQSWERTFTVFGHQIPYEQIRLQIGKESDKLMPVFFSLEKLNTSDDGQSPLSVNGCEITAGNSTKVNIIRG